MPGALFWFAPLQRNSTRSPSRKVGASAYGTLRFLKAMDESRQRQVEREIAKYVALRGGRITDDLEREITRRLLTSDWGPRE